MYELESKTLKGLDWQLRKTQTTWEATIGNPRAHWGSRLSIYYPPPPHLHTECSIQVCMTKWLYDFSSANKLTVCTGACQGGHYLLGSSLEANMGKDIQRVICEKQGILISVKLTGSRQTPWPADGKTSFFQLSKLCFSWAWRSGYMEPYRQKCPGELLLLSFGVMTKLTNTKGKTFRYLNVPTAIFS